jgi:replication-associated recombination protein RarA
MHSLFPSDDDWKDRVLSRIEVTSIGFEDSAALVQCDRWVAASLLQKAVRRGETQLALRAAFTLHQFDRASVWRRLMIIAVEDIGAAEPDAIAEAVAIATSSAW